MGLSLKVNNQNNYIKSWPTFKIIEVINSSHGCSITGKDFQELIPELEQEYYRRMNKIDEENAVKLVKEYEFIYGESESNIKTM